MYMVMVVLSHLERLEALLQAWHSAGVHEVTVMEGSGFGACVRTAGRVHARFDFGQAEHCGHGQYTVVGMAGDDDALARGIAAAETAIGRLLPGSGNLLAAWPLVAVRGAALPACDSGGS